MSAISVLSHVRSLESPHGQLTVLFGCTGSWLLCHFAGVPVFPFGVLIPLLTIASVTDLTSRRIPNWLTYSAIAFALSAAAIVSVRATSGAVVLPGVAGLRESVSGFAATFGIMLLIYFIFGTGAGDVKLAGAIGACVGVQTGLHAILWTHLIAGLAMTFFVAWRVGPLWIIRAVNSRLFPDRVLMPAADHSRTFRYPVPMAVYFAIGTIIALMEVPLP